MVRRLILTHPTSIATYWVNIQYSGKILWNRHCYLNKIQASMTTYNPFIPNKVLFAFLDIHTNMISWCRSISGDHLGHGDEVICEEIGGGLICSYEIPIIITWTKSKPLWQLGTLSSPIKFCLPFLTSIQIWIHDAEAYLATIWAMEMLFREIICVRARALSPDTHRSAPPCQRSMES